MQAFIDTWNVDSDGDVGILIRVGHESGELILTEDELMEMLVAIQGQRSA